MLRLDEAGTLESGMQATRCTGSSSTGVEVAIGSEEAVEIDGYFSTLEGLEVLIA